MGGGMTTPAYGPSSFADGRPRESPAIVVPIVNELVSPKSVLDVGCGTGAWLAEWTRAGVTDSLGLDGEYVQPELLKIPAIGFRATDLRRPFWLERRFDLVESLEVAEHLEERFADAFVESLTRHADTILFSAAIPGQGGNGHVNEQWPSYWAEKFGRLGFDLYDVVRPLIWSDPRVRIWYRQNTFFFSKVPIGGTPGAVTDIVHPEYWAREAGPRTVGQLVGHLRRHRRTRRTPARPKG
jgi:SAM-dependent methyltransferase